MRKAMTIDRCVTYAAFVLGLCMPLTARLHAQSTLTHQHLLRIEQVAEKTSPVHVIKQLGAVVEDSKVLWHGATGVVEVRTAVPLDLTTFNSLFTGTGYVATALARYTADSHEVVLVEGGAEPFPIYWDTGHGDVDNARYAAAKERWVATYPERYRTISIQPGLQKAQ